MIKKFKTENNKVKKEMLMKKVQMITNNNPSCKIKQIEWSLKFNKLMQTEDYL